MSVMSNSIENRVKAFCTEIGEDSLLVQGAGGNVSWKEDNVLWVKASGMWLADAELKEIFVPVDLSHLQAALASKDFSVVPQVKGASDLRPSIETLLHALMPHRVVVHLHSIEILAHVVRANFREQFDALIGDSVNFECTDYHKPGSELASSISEILKNNPNADVVFMKNHGVVIGGEDIEEIRNVLCQLNDRLLLLPKCNLHEPKPSPVPNNLQAIYSPLTESNISLLATEPSLFDRLKSDWCLYPDHIVFLGATADTYTSWEEVQEQVNHGDNYPELIFIKSHGVYITSKFSISQEAQLKCYLDVLIRQEAGNDLCSMSDSSVMGILGWDAENYRIDQVKFK